MNLHVTPILTACFVVGLLSATRCTTTPDEPQLQQWTETEAGLAKLEELIADATTDMALRVQAFHSLVKSGHSTRLRPILDKATDDERFAAAVVPPLLEKMESGIAGVDCKNAVMSMFHLLTPEERDSAQKRIASWAFAGLGENSSATEIVQTTEQRILLGQIEDLGIHGVGGALLLLSNNIAVPRFYAYLRSFKNADIDAKILAGLKKVENLQGFQLIAGHIERIADIGTSDSIVALLDLYDSASDKDLAATAFNAGSALLLKPEVTANAETKLIARLEPYLTGKNPDDRWFAASTTVALGGSTAVASVLDALPDDSAYATGTVDAQKALVDFCARVIKSLGSEARSTFRERLQSEKRITKVVALVGLKAAAAIDDIPAIEPLLKDNTSVADILGDELSIAKVAQNAKEGILACEKLQQNKEKEEEPNTTELKKFALLTVLHLTGTELTEEADRRFQALKPNQP